MTAPGVDKAASPQLDVRTRLEILDNVGCGIWLFDGVDVRYVNAAMEQLTGYTRTELLQPGFFSSLLHPDSVQAVWDRGVARIRGEPVPEEYEAAIIARGGRVVHLALHARQIALPIGVCSLVSATDITPQKVAERLRGTSEAYYRTLLDAIPAHVITTNAAGEATFVNRHWTDYTGQSMARAMSRGTGLAVHREDAPAAADHWAEAMATQTGYEIDYRVRRADGVYRWQSWRIEPVRDTADGELLGWTGVGIDVDDAKRLQLELGETNRQLAIANAVKDDFLALVSHELRTPLTTISGMAELLVRRIDTLSDHDRIESLAQVQRDAERLQSVVENLLVLARLDQEGIEFEPVLAQRVAGAVLRSYTAAHPQRRLRLAAPLDAPAVLSQPTLLRLVLENLVGNAIKYSPPAAPVEVRLQPAEDHLEVSVLDRGWGIGREDRVKIFEPFYRTPEAAHSRAPGAGLGLAVARRLVELHGGTIGVRPRRDGGTVFSFTLPTVQALDADGPTGN
jgi:PAS domain S-box-containing protein